MTKAQTKASLALWRRRLTYRKRRLLAARRANIGPRIERWKRLVAQAEKMVARREHVAIPLRRRALTVAEGLVGVMEQGGNNAGPMVSRIIRANGGAGPEPWCGDFVAYCYRLAGSKSVTRAWAAVRLLSGVAGIRRVRQPLAGDLVRFTFSHVGLFVKDNGNGTITTIEGNTGASGAVSDSKTGGDGVYIKVRAKSLVTDYLRVGR